MLYQEDHKDGHSEHDKKEKHEGKKCSCTSCVCEFLLDIFEHQQKNRDVCEEACSLRSNVRHHEIIPFILQTPYGHPFFTFGKVGTDDCFVTVFFKVVKVDCKKNCAILKLLKPNISLIDHETDCVEIDKICEVDFLTITNECVLVDLSCYSAVKLVSPEIVKKHI